MRRAAEERLAEIRGDHRRRRVYAVLFAVVACMLAAVVAWLLHQPGVSLTEIEGGGASEVEVSATASSPTDEGAAEQAALDPSGQADPSADDDTGLPATDEAGSADNGAAGLPDNTLETGGQAASDAGESAQGTSDASGQDGPAPAPTPHDNGVPAGFDATSYIAHNQLQQQAADSPSTWADVIAPASDAIASRVVVSLERIPSDELVANANQAFVRLPDGADCSGLVAGQPYALTSGEEGATACGTYAYARDDAGIWYAVLTVDASFIESASYSDASSERLVFDAAFACAVAWDADYLANLSPSDDEAAEGASATFDQSTDAGSSDAAVLAAAISVNGVQGLDLGDHLADVRAQKKVGAVWQDATEFTTDDQVRISLSYTGVSKEELQANGYRAFVKLPDHVDCSKFAGQAFPMYDGSTQTGTYGYVQGEDGSWYMELSYNSSYVDEAQDNIGGGLQFDFNWTDDAASDEGGETVVKIGNWECTVVIKKGEGGQGGETGKNLGVKKTAGELSYSEDGSMVYIDYTVELTVAGETAAPIELTDVLDGTGFAYDEGSLAISAANGGTPSVSWKANQDGGDGTRTAAISVGEQGETIAPGTYTLTYRVQSTEAAKVGVTTDGELSNKVTARDGDKDVSGQTHTKTSSGTLAKQGTYAEGEDGASYIDWTVCINTGDIVKNLTEPSVFTDTLPDGLELVGDVTVSQYAPNGALVSQGSDGVHVDGTSISYTTPTGQYYYVITYRTKVTSDVPLGGETFDNTAHSQGGITGEATGSVTVPNSGVEKSFISQDVHQQGDSWVDVMDWTTQVTVAGSLKGYVYEDYSDLAQDSSTGKNVSAMFMTDEQMAGITVRDADGNLVDPSRYTVSRSDRMDRDVVCGLFKIAFGDDVVGPVSISYQTTADLGIYSEGAYVHFRNLGLLTDGDGHSDSTSATSTVFTYTHGDIGVIHKFGGSWSTGGSSKYQLKPGETSIAWNIDINDDRKLSGDLTVTDTIAQGMEFDPSSFTLSVRESVGTDLEKVTWEYDAVTRTLKIFIPESAYVSNGHSSPIAISYRTELGEDFLGGAEDSRDYTNTAHIDYADGSQSSTHTQTVSKETVAKSGRFDAENNQLIYEIVLNPYAAQLNGGKALTVTDVLDAGELAPSVHLSSLALYTAVQKEGENGSVSIVPGRLVRELREGADAQEYTYQYDDDSKTFVAYVPDETAYVMVATYTLDNAPAVDVPTLNRVQVSGVKSWNASDSSTKAEQHTSGTTYTGTHKLALVKHDASQFNAVLSGAQFSLERYNVTTQAWVSVATLTTDADGSASTGIDANVLYRLTELAAPKGYLLDPTPSYFVVTSSSSTGQSPALPDAIVGDDDYSPDKVEVRTVRVSKGANVVFDRYDERDNTVVETGQIRVLKTWKDASGEVVGDSVELASLPQVSVTLTKHTAGNTVTVAAGAWSGAQTVTIKTTKANQCVQWQVQSWQKSQIEADLTSSSVAHDWSGSDSAGWTLTLGPITADCTVYSGTLAWMSGYSLVGGTDGATTDTVVGTAVLNAANDWTYVWSGLEAGEGVTYTVSEAVPEGYRASYTVNGTELTDGALPTFELGGNGTLVGVVNAPTDKAWELPKTGGAGTMLFFASGFALVIIACACGLARRFCKGRRRFD